MWFRYSLRKMIELFANSVDPDQMPRSAASDMGLHCLPITALGVWNGLNSKPEDAPRVTITEHSLLMTPNGRLKQFTWSYPGNATMIRKHSLPKDQKKKRQELTMTRHSGTVAIYKENNNGKYKRNSEPPLQRQHLFPKTLPLKRICCCSEYLMC